MTLEVRSTSNMANGTPAADELHPDNVKAAYIKIQKYIHDTPLVTSATMDAIASHPNPAAFLGANPPTFAPTKADLAAAPTPTPRFKLWFKCENQQKIGAFKARGAHHALIRLIEEHGVEHVRARGVVTHSSGNHAQALALAAHTFQVPSYVVMPTISTPSKIAGTRVYTPNVIFSGSTSDEREAKVAEVVRDTGAILVPPYDHPYIILGQGTAAYDMERQFQAQNINRDTSIDTDTYFDAVLAPLGGGGLLGGTATWFSHLDDTDTNTDTNTNANHHHHHHLRQEDRHPSEPTRPRKRTLVIGTEPSLDGANDAEQGLTSQPPTRIPHVKSLTIADGLRTPVGHLNWEIVSDPSKVHGVYSASENEITDALRLMMERTKMFLEPSAVVPVAVVLFNAGFRARIAELQRREGTGRAWDVGVVLSGGNTTVEALAKLFAPETVADEVRVQRQTAEVGLDGRREVEDVAG